MSWDADLVTPDGETIGEWNYTHNTNGMIDAVLDAAPVESFAPQVFGSCWWRTLNGMEGPEGAAFLHRIVTGLEADPARFRAMNPENGWGDYDQLVGVLWEMVRSVPERHATWEVCG